MLIEHCQQCWWVVHMHLYVINITDSQFVTIANIMFKNRYTSSTYKRLSNLKFLVAFPAE